jgi:hypothetical protein
MVAARIVGLTDNRISTDAKMSLALFMITNFSPPGSFSKLPRPTVLYGEGSINILD